MFKSTCQLSIDANFTSLMVGLSPVNQHCQGKVMQTKQSSQLIYSQKHLSAQVTLKTTNLKNKVLN